MDRKTGLVRRRQLKPFAQRAKDHCRQFTAFMFSNVGIIILVVVYMIGGKRRHFILFIFEITSIKRSSHHIRKLRIQITSLWMRIYEEPLKTVRCFYILIYFEYSWVRRTHIYFSDTLVPHASSHPFYGKINILLQTRNSLRLRPNGVSDLSATQTDTIY